MTQVWLIRNDVYNKELEQGGFVSIGWDGTRALDNRSLESSKLVGELVKLYPASSKRTLQTWAATLRRFHNDVAKAM